MNLFKVVVMASIMTFFFSGVAAASGCGSPTNSCYYQQQDKKYLNSGYIYGPNGQFSWTQNALGAANTLTGATLSINAWDVDSPYEVDTVYGFSNQTNNWVSIGNLTGFNNYNSTTSFSLGSDWYDEIAQGLKLKVLFKSQYYAASLNWSKLAVTGDNCLPPVNAVPVPAALWLFTPALLGFTAMRRRAKKA